MMHKLRTFSHGNSIALQFAGITLAVGSIIFLSALSWGTDALLGVGIVFLFCAVFINGLMLLGVLIRSFNEQIPVQETIFTMYMCLLNIPIALLFIKILSL